MIWIECGRRVATASRDSTAPLGLPGRLRMSVVPRMAAMPGERMARGVCSRPLRRISSAMRGINFSAMVWVASGVESRWPRPVPPVVRIRSTWPSSANCRRSDFICSGSSGRRCVAATVQLSCWQRASTAGPEASLLVPCATESLMVITAIFIEGYLHIREKKENDYRRDGEEETQRARRKDRRKGRRKKEERKKKETG